MLQHCSVLSIFSFFFLTESTRAWDVRENISTSDPQHCFYNGQTAWPLLHQCLSIIIQTFFTGSCALLTKTDSTLNYVKIRSDGSFIQLHAGLVQYFIWNFGINFSFFRCFTNSIRWKHAIAMMLCCGIEVVLCLIAKIKPNGLLKSDFVEHTIYTESVIQHLKNTGYYHHFFYSKDGF